MIHHYYPELFAHEKAQLQEAKRFIGKTYEFSQFMVKVLGVEDVGARFPHRVTYHPSCHGTRLLGVRQEPLTLLRHVKDLDLVPLPHAEDCCGFGGTFSVKLGDVSAKMVQEKVENIVRTGAEYVVGMDKACLMNISGYMKRHDIGVETLHLTELLDRGLNGKEAPA
jgi:L-lactate dehydrogenase complex protein LldE